MSPFMMQSDSRARRAAKDLKSILHSNQIELTLKQCQGAVARMLGHADWPTLMATIGTGHSPDDALVTPEERVARHAVQREVLIRIGLPEARADEVRARLSLTGRSQADMESMPIVFTESTYQYHPQRILDATESMARLRMGLLMRQSGKQVSGREFSELETPNYSLLSLADDLEKWMDDTTVTPLDEASFHPYMFEFLYADAREVLSETCFIIDASAVAEGLARKDVSEEIHTGKWPDMPLMYVHLGTNAFPSPFPGCGIEGCYVELEGGGKSEHGSITVTFIASPELNPGMSIYEDLSAMPYDGFLMSMRHLRVSVDADEEGRIRLGDILDAENQWEHHDDYAQTWKPYLVAPLNAAWSAIKAERTLSIPVTDGLHSDVDGDLVRKLRRARTPDQRTKAMKAIAEENGEFLVRFVGGVPAEATDIDALPRQIEFPGVPVSNHLHWAYAYMRMADDADYGIGRLSMADRALKMIDLAQVDEHEPTDLIDAKVEALYHKVEALADMGRPSEAMTELLTAIDLNSSDSLGLGFRLPALLAMNGDGKGAASYLKERTKDNLEGHLQWSRALLAARFSSEEDRKRELAKAVALNRHVAVRLLEDQPRERWRDSELVLEYGHAYWIAGLLRDGWKTVPDYKVMLTEALNDFGTNPSNEDLLPTLG